MTTRKDEKLFGACYAVCQISFCGEDPSRRAVFSATEVDEKGREKPVYYCGIGRTDCIIARYGQKFNEDAQRAYAALNAKHE